MAHRAETDDKKRLMTANRIAALFMLALYLSGLAAWVAKYGVPAWIVGAFICVLSVIICLTSDEDTPPFNFTLFTGVGSFLYLCIGAGMYFLNIRTFFE
jgi:4-hydroxybenzoate polyprenyltransferase